MLGIEENIQAINFCEYYIGQDKTEVKFLLEAFTCFGGPGEFLLNYNTETRRMIENDEAAFTIVNLNQVVTVNLFSKEAIQYEMKYNILETIRYLDTKQIVTNEWMSYYVRDSTEMLEYRLQISVYLSEFNKKQLLDIRLKTLLAVHNRVEQIEIEKNDNPLKKRTRKSDKKKTANLVYTILLQDPTTVSPIKKPEVEIKVKEIPLPKVVFPPPGQEGGADGKPPPEFEFQAKVDCCVY